MDPKPYKSRNFVKIVDDLYVFFFFFFFFSFGINMNKYDKYEHKYE